MKIVKYLNMSDDAMTVRNEVFVKEQGFVDEFDENDAVSAHFVMYDVDTPIATCRIFKKDDDGTFMFGRLAVVAAHRKKGYGSKMVCAAEEHARSEGGTRVILHAQLHAKGFYESIGYCPVGEVEEEQGCPHIWMEKKI